MNKKIAIVLIAIILGVLLIIGRSNSPTGTVFSPNPQTPTVLEKDPPIIVSTKPDPLNEAIVSTTDILEITFNRPLENVGEFKSRIEPKVDYKVELSSDRKTAKITSTKPLDLGTTFTLFIGPETKFDGVGRWGQEKVFHFKTIKYRGI